MNFLKLLLFQSGFIVSQGSGVYSGGFLRLTSLLGGILDAVDVKYRPQTLNHPQLRVE